jgi:hypothetical protein
VRRIRILCCNTRPRRRSVPLRQESTPRETRPESQRRERGRNRPTAPRLTGRPATYGAPHPLACPLPLRILNQGNPVTSPSSCCSLVLADRPSLHVRSFFLFLEELCSSCSFIDTIRGERESGVHAFNQVNHSRVCAVGSLPTFSRPRNMAATFAAKRHRRSGDLISVNLKN